MLFELIDKNAEALATMGERAIAQANNAGVPAYFMDDRLGEGVLRQMPDGTLQRVSVDRTGRISLIETLPTRR
jgi:hypothetical protein